MAWVPGLLPVQRARACLPARAQLMPLDVAVRSQPASGHVVGGDFWDVFPIDGSSWGLLVGDAAGSGVAAAPLAAFARRSIRASATPTSSPGSALRHTNRALLQVARSAEDPPLLVTAALGYVTPNRDGVHVRLVSAGHVPPLIVRHGHVERVAVRGTLLGAVDEVSIPACSVQLLPGDALVVCTDGVTESRDTDGRFLDDAGLVAAVADAWGRPAAMIAASIAQLAVEHSGGTTRDDLTVLVVTTS